MKTNKIANAPKVTLQTAKLPKVASIQRSLDNEMLDALNNDKVTEVDLLIKNGFKMDNFLTIPRLESLYNTNKGPPNTLSYIIRDVTKTHDEYKYNLPDIGLAMEKLMGGSYESHYCSKEFKTKWTVSKLEHVKKDGNIASKTVIRLNPTKTTRNELNSTADFKHPFSDLFIWAVLTKRQEMALFLWQHGGETLTKALIAIRLYTYLSYEASDDFLVQEIYEDYQRHAREFQQLSVEFLERCWRENRDYTLLLLTYQLDYWGKQTNLSLAVVANHKEFLAHACCQFLLSDLWLGGLRIRRYATIKIILGLFLPAFILTLNFKSKDELALQPQRADEIDVEESSLRLEASHLEQGVLKSRHGSPLVSPNASTKSSSLVSTKAKRCSQMPPMKVHMTTGQRIASTYQYQHGFNNMEQPLSPAKKFYEFYVAPQTTFWIWSIAYSVFLMFFTYTALTAITPLPDGPEYYIMAYVVTFTLENFRRIIISEGRNFGLKIQLYFNQPWVKMYAMAILFFYMAMTLRFMNGMLEYARICYACDIVFWYWLLLDLFSGDFQIGVYVSMLKKMIIGMFQVLSILSVVLISFGVVREAIKFPNREWNWLMARNIVYKPYFMLYGEVYTSEIDPCNDFSADCDIAGHWITPVYMAIFMIVSNILVINLMIAVFNHIFNDINAKSQEVWRFSRYWVVLNYEYKPFLPPPFIIFYHLYFIVKLLIQRKKHGRWFEFALKLILSAENLAHIHEFEGSCIKILNENRDISRSASIDNTIKRTNRSVKLISDTLNSFTSQFQTFERQQAEILKVLKKK